VADERVCATLRQLRQRHPESGRLSRGRFKEIVREQYLLLRHDEARALAAIPRLLASDPTKRETVLDAVRQAAEAVGDLPEDAKQRLLRVKALFRSDVLDLLSGLTNTASATRSGRIAYARRLAPANSVRRPTRTEEPDQPGSRARRPQLSEEKRT
jgi:hypothetical protein